MTIQTTAVLIALVLLIVAVVWAAHAADEAEENYKLLLALRYIRDRAERGVFARSHSGVCARLTASLTLRFLNAAQKWPGHSGEYYFPVPHPTKPPSTAYIESPLWDRSTEYGRNRLELIDYVINQLDKKNARQ